MSEQSTDSLIARVGWQASRPFACSWGTITPQVRVGWERDAGVVAGIDDSGHLLVDTDRGERVALGAGEVHLAVS